MCECEWERDSGCIAWGEEGVVQVRVSCREVVNQTSEVVLYVQEKSDQTKRICNRLWNNIKNKEKEAI